MKKMHKFGFFVFCAVLSLGFLACAKASPGDNNVNDNDNINVNVNQNTNNNISPGGGHPAQAIVAGGNVMQSPNYRLVLTTGQSPGGSGVATSPGYRLQGGVVGATQ